MRYAEATVAVVKYPVRDEQNQLVRDEQGRVKNVEQYVARIAVLPGSDEMWDYFYHPAHFRDEARCAKLVERINRRRHAIDLKQWVFPGHACSPFVAGGPNEYSVL